jgi:hypothetical protein
MATGEPSSPATSTQEKEPSLKTGGVHTTPLYNPDVDVSGVDERKLVRKLDWWLIPWLSFLYLLSFLDRTGIGK